MAATENEVLLHALDHAYDTTSWHGPNLRGAIRGLSHVEAARRPAKGRHSVWELAVHCAYWKYTVRRRITGEKRGSFPLEGSNWFARDVKDGAAQWKADVALLDEIHRSLRTEVERFPERRWGEKVKGSRWTYRDIVAGVAAHDLYHAGQMRLVKVLARS
jgi:uncharacterized damage-inducible protein DinB